MLSLALVGFIWQLQYSQDYGLHQLRPAEVGHHRQPIDWYGDPSVNIWAVLVATCWQHVGYIMLLYLAGLKGVDPSLREAAEVDGASEVQTFFRIIFPVMRPINVIVFVITVIQALRAFDIVWVVNKGRNGLELISALVTQNVVGEASRVGFGSALATIMLVVSLVFIVIYLVDRPARGGAVSALDTPSTPAPAAGAGDRRPQRRRGSRRGGGRWRLRRLPDRVALLWLFPLFWSVLSSLRDYNYTSEHGYISLGGWTLAQLQERLAAGGLHHALPQLGLHDGAGGAAHAVPRVDGRRSSSPASRGGSTSSCSACSPPRTCCPSRPC